MKKIIFTTALIIICISTFSQKKNINIQQKKKVRNFISFYPSEFDKANGLLINYWLDESNTKLLNKNRNELQINGIELGLNPVTFFAPFFSLIYAVPIITENPISPTSQDITKKINGLQLGFASLKESKINGIEINVAGNFNSIVNGLSITPIINKHYKVSGIDISILGNIDYKVNGIQIGLFNRATQLKGIQIGLWNKNEKRSLPFINWNFKN
ncbi:MAG: hypothetical protein AB8B78_02160 [Polaribacter sp.]